MIKLGQEGDTHKNVVALAPANAGVDVGGGCG